MTISKTNDVDYDLDSKELLYAKYASNTEESLEGILEVIEIILNRIRNVECTSKQVKTYQEKIDDLFFKAKQVINNIKDKIDELNDEDKEFFKEIKTKFSMLKEEVELIDFDAILDYTMSCKKVERN